MRAATTQSQPVLAPAAQIEAASHTHTTLLVLASVVAIANGTTVGSWPTSHGARASTAGRPHP